MEELRSPDKTQSSRRWLDWFSREDGQSAFEFVLMLPFFLLFVLLMIDLAFLGFSYISVANAAREGARYGAVNCGVEVCNEDLIDTRVMQRSSGIISDATKVSVSWYESNNRGAPVAVSVAQPYNFIFFPGVSIPVASCAEMRLEQSEPTATVGGSGC